MPKGMAFIIIKFTFLRQNPPRSGTFLFIFLSKNMWPFLVKHQSLTTEAKQDALKKQIVKLFLDEGEKTIPEVCHFARLSIPTGTKLLEDLMRLGFLTEIGKRDSLGGRRPAIFGLNPDKGYVIGVEVLLHSLRVNIVNLRQEVVYEYENQAFDLSKKEEAFEFLCGIIPELIASQKIPRDKILGVGMGITGRISPWQGISYSYLNFDVPLVKLLTDEWQLPVYIDNDTHLMTLGEMRFGLARGLQNVVYVNISRGLGVGIISNGMIHNGHSGYAGEFGHILAEENGRLCVCGKRGCLGGVVSGFALETAYQELYPTPGQPAPHYKQILRMALDGDEAVQHLLFRMGAQLGQSLAILIDIFNPEMIILGGGFSFACEWMKESIIRGIHLHSLPQLAAECEIRVSDLGDKAEMLGAFALVFDEVLRG